MRCLRIPYQYYQRHHIPELLDQPAVTTPATRSPGARAQVPSLNERELLLYREITEELSSEGELSTLLSGLCAPTGSSGGQCAPRLPCAQSQQPAGPARSTTRLVA
jgi:hypothetical protein